jgi:hypothetical protein
MNGTHRLGLKAWSSTSFSHLGHGDRIEGDKGGAINLFFQALKNILGVYSTRHVLPQEAIPGRHVPSDAYALLCVSKPCSTFSLWMATALHHWVQVVMFKQLLDEKRYDMEMGYQGKLLTTITTITFYFFGRELAIGQFLIASLTNGLWTDNRD